MEYRTAGDLLSDKLRFSLDTVHEQVKLVTASHVPHCRRGRTLLGVLLAMDEYADVMDRYADVTYIVRSLQ